jgi:hypothetical protein
MKATFENTHLRKVQRGKSYVFSGFFAAFVHLWNEVRARYVMRCMLFAGKILFFFLIASSDFFFSLFSSFVHRCSVLP